MFFYESDVSLKPKQNITKTKHLFFQENPTRTSSLDLFLFMCVCLCFMDRLGLTKLVLKGTLNNSKQPGVDLQSR